MSYFGPDGGSRGIDANGDPLPEESIVLAPSQVEQVIVVDGEVRRIPPHVLPLRVKRDQRVQDAEADREAERYRTGEDFS